MTSFQRFRRFIVRKGGDGYTIIPNFLLNGKRLKVNGCEMELRHRLLLIALMSFDFRGGVFKVGSRALKNTAGLGNDAVIAATRELTQAGLLKVSRMPNCLNEYDLTLFYDMVVESESLNISDIPNTSEAPLPKYVRLADLDLALRKNRPEDP